MIGTNLSTTIMAFHTLLNYGNFDKKGIHSFTRKIIFNKGEGDQDIAAQE